MAADSISSLTQLYKMANKMENLTIYNTYVPMESQEQVDRMRNICTGNGLPIWVSSAGWNFFSDGTYLSYSKEENEFFAFAGKSNLNKWAFSEVTESEWLELLKTTK